MTKNEPKITVRIDGNLVTVNRETKLKFAGKRKESVISEVVTLFFGRPGRDPVTTRVTVDERD
jgi:hypothetical protein